MIVSKLLLLISLAIAAGCSPFDNGAPLETPAQKKKAARERYNTGQSFDRKGVGARAIEEYEACLAIDPAHELCRKALRALAGKG